MRKNIQYTAVILALAAFVVSCNKVDNNIPGDDLISFAPQATGTKAMVDDKAGLQTQTFAVKDIVDGTLYIDNAVAYNGTGWVYSPNPDDAKKYLWKNGTHKLFGYTADMGTFAGTTLTLPSTTLTTTYDQTDLLYSDIVTTTADAWKAANGKGVPVPLHFHHLLSALSLGLVNYTGSNITLNSVTVKLPNKAAPTISFAAATPAATIGTVTESGNFHEVTSAVSLPNKDTLDVFSNAVITGKDTPAPRMTWPGDYAKGAVTVTVNYTPAGQTTPVEKTLSFPAVAWAAGKVNAYNILLYPDKLDLIFEVQPWQSVALGTVDTKNSINMSNVTWQNTKVKLTQEGAEQNTVVNSAYSVNMFYKPYIKDGDTWTQYTANNGYFPAQGFFTVNYPMTGTYKIGLMPAVKSAATPDPDAVFNESMYEIYIYKQTGTDAETGDPIYGWVKHNPETGEAVSNDTVYFQVRASSNVAAAHSEYKAQINIWFKGTEEGDEWVSAYSEIRANYALIIPAVN